MAGAYPLHAWVEDDGGATSLHLGACRKCTLRSPRQRSRNKTTPACQINPSCCRSIRTHSTPGLRTRKSHTPSPRNPQEPTTCTPGCRLCRRSAIAALATACSAAGRMTPSSPYCCRSSSRPSPPLPPVSPLPSSRPPSVLALFLAPTNQPPNRHNFGAFRKLPVARIFFAIG